MTTSATPSATASPTGTLEQQEGAWFSGPGGTDLSAIANDLNKIHSVGVAEDATAMGAACRQLQTDTLKEASDPPNPEPQVESYLTTARADLKSAAETCIRGVQSQDTSEMNQAITEMNQAASQLQLATNATDATSSAG